jgi:hypothetical protein
MIISGVGKVKTAIMEHARLRTAIGIVSPQGAVESAEEDGLISVRSSSIAPCAANFRHYLFLPSHDSVRTQTFVKMR